MRGAGIIAAQAVGSSRSVIAGDVLGALGLAFRGSRGELEPFPRLAFGILQLGFHLQLAHWLRQIPADRAVVRLRAD